VHPDARERLAGGRLGLRDLVLVVRELQVESAAMDVERFAQLIPCGAGAQTGGDETACASQFIRQFGRRAYRRPVVAEEADRLMALYTAGRTQLMLNYAGAIQLIMPHVLRGLTRQPN
jgi:hypothetical protein